MEYTHENFHQHGEELIFANLHKGIEELAFFLQREPDWQEVEDFMDDVENVIFEEEKAACKVEVAGGGVIGFRAYEYDSQHDYEHGWCVVFTA